MSETDTKRQPEIRTVEEWAQLKGTRRWVLCLAATHAGWLPEQEDDAQDEVTEEAYDAAVADAEAAYERLRLENQTVKGADERDVVRAIVHPTFYAGAIVKRMTPTEVKAMRRDLERKAKSRDADEAGRAAGEYFLNAVLFPDRAKLELLRRRMCDAVEQVLPTRWFMSLGADGGDRVKKR